jgi:hypothetical protein
MLPTLRLFPKHHCSACLPACLSAVGSLDVPGISAEVASAVRRVVAEQSAGLHSTLTAAAATPAGAEAAPAAQQQQRLAGEASALASRLVPALTSEQALPNMLSFRCCSCARLSQLCKPCCELFTHCFLTHSIFDAAINSLSACLPSPAGEVQRVLRVHLEQLRQSPTIAPFAVRVEQGTARQAAGQDGITSACSGAWLWLQQPEL